jgi:hypothetical protein
MRVAELRSLLTDLPDNDHVCVAAWFEDGERLYIPHRELGDVRTVEGRDGRFHVIGRFDNCYAHQVNPAAVATATA